MTAPNTAKSIETAMTAMSELSPMSDKEFQRLLDKCARAAERHKLLCDMVNGECHRRYDVGYSDVDADGIIEVLDIHGGKITVKQFDEQMQFSLSMRY